MTTYKTFLMIKKSASGDYEKLADIKNVPAMGSERNTVDVTTLSDDTEQLEPGIKRVGDGYQFTCNYDPVKYKEIDGYGDTVYDFAVWKGGTGSGSNVIPTGSEGKWGYKAKATVGTAEGDVDAAFDMVITLFPQSSPDFSYDADNG